ncbi:MAG TPA: hypothetical protein VEX11_12975 [Acetobacteraceae bacterium]|nr:hypothetical protein [Acetobacteraceae bacterium]
MIDLVGYPRRDGALLQGVLALVRGSGEVMEVREEHPYLHPRVRRFARLE